MYFRRKNALISGHDSAKVFLADNCIPIQTLCLKSLCKQQVVIFIPELD